MKLIVGLGNPGMEYVHTRHNVGFDTVNLFAKKKGFKFSRKGKAMVSENNIEGEKVVLLKPLTFMNLSGEAVARIMNTYNVTDEDLIVVCDDLDLPLGKIRIRRKGSGGGHRGLNSIIDCIKSNNFCRLRVGIGREGDTVNYVLGRFSSSDRKIMEEAFERAVGALEALLTETVDKVMNDYN